MKALFYTATAVFIALAGVIAYFALQSPSSVGGARIVLDIDVSGMPQIEGSAANAPLDPYGDEKDDKPEDAAQAAPSAQDNGPAQRSDAGAIEPRADVPSRDRDLRDAQREEVPAPPPGTALAGLQQDRPLFRELSPEPQSPTGASAQQERPEAAEAPESLLPGTNIDLPPSEPAQRQTAHNSADAPADTPAPATQTPTANSAASLPAQAAVVAPVLPPPPVPVRRPNDIAGSEERLAAANGNFGGVQFATTEVNTPKEARIAILLRGVGRNERDGNDAIARLPSAVSLGFLPYSASAQRLATKARDKGHEIIVQLPLEPVDYPTSDPGPDTLLTSLPPAENMARLDTVLTRFQGYSGVTNFMGGKMLQSKTSLKPVLEDIKARGLLYVGESNNSSAAVKQVAREINLRYGAAQVLIDAQATPDAIDKALTRLIALARQNGSAIGMGTATGMTITQVQAWSEKLAAQGITLVPVGALAQTPGSS
jgi:uncharacterized protein